MLQASRDPVGITSLRLRLQGPDRLPKVRLVNDLDPLEQHQHWRERVDALWRTLVRYDAYIASTIARAAATTALNAAVSAALLLNAGKIVAVATSWPGRTPMICLLGGGGLTSLASMAFSFAALFPHLRVGSGTGKDGPGSMIFFGDVARRAPTAFPGESANRSLAEMHADLARQVYEVAVGLRRKYLHLGVATALVVVGLLPIAGLVGALLMVAVLNGDRQ